MINFNAINKDWTLFLDRDGVINEDKPASYIFNAEEFSFSHSADKAIAILSSVFGLTIVVTNQRGIGKGLMTVSDLDAIHKKMINGVELAGGHIDKIYFAPEVNNDSPRRKPAPGMALEAKADFPQIDFEKSIMVGNKLSDMEFGKNIGAQTVFIPSTNPEVPYPHPLIDFRAENLLAFAEAFRINKH